MRWFEVSPDPNSPEALGYRRAQLAPAWDDRSSTSRIGLILDQCRGKAVLDVGAVGHFRAAIDSPDWLHRKIAAVARSVVGIDTSVEGIDRMREQGFQALVHRLGDPGGELSGFGRFDVIVAGELIEHLDSPLSLFHLAREVLRPGGTLIITTPNPYAPWRARAGQLRLTWENVDHVAYYFPSGIAELADRSGLRLLRMASTEYDDNVRPRRVLRGLLASIKQFLNGRRAYLQDPSFFTPLEILGELARRNSPRGETMIYVLGLPPAAAVDNLEVAP